MLFGALQVYCDDAPRSAAMNMAVDEALLECAADPTIRFYQWDHPAISFGYFGRYGDVASHQERCDLVRRWTGGGIVFHGEDLTYSLVIPQRTSAFAKSSLVIYEDVHRALCDALVANAVTAELVSVAALYERRNELNPAVNANACFANPVRADILVEGQKVAGAAQRRSRLGLLQQGSIQHVELPKGFKDKFAANLSADCRYQPLNGALLERAKVIADRKYATPSWLHRR